LSTKVGVTGDIISHNKMKRNLNIKKDEVEVDDVHHMQNHLHLSALGEDPFRLTKGQLMMMKRHVSSSENVSREVMEMKTSF
jgi:hypothetical protein